MGSFRYEMHLHTSETSGCARVSAKEIPALYADKGYHVLVVTDHYSPYFFSNKSFKEWPDLVDEYLRGYYVMGEEGIKNDIQVLLGMELTFIDGPNDYLVYGISREFLLNNPRLYEMDIKSFHKIAKKNKLFVAQAHPFRRNMTRANPKHLNGVEIFNGNTNHNSNDAEALRFCKENKLIGIAGSDFHEYDHLARGGIIMDRYVNDSAELAENLLRGNIEGIIYKGKDCRSAE